MLTRKTQEISCKNCGVSIPKYLYCSRRCQNTYNARQRRQASSTQIYLSSCKECNINIKRPKRQFCTKRCKDRYKQRVDYKGLYQKRYISSSPTTYFKSLLHKNPKRDRSNLSVDDLVSLYNKQNGLCAISGIKLTHIQGSGRVLTNIAIDRIDSSKGYELDNIQLLCYIVNVMKWTMTTEELLEWCKIILEKNKKD